MFNRKAIKEKTGLEEAREVALSELASYSSHDDEYSKIMDHVKTLSELIDAEAPEKLSPNTVAVVLGNVGIGLLFTIYESKNVVTTKVVPFLMKLK